MPSIMNGKIIPSNELQSVVVDVDPGQGGKALAESCTSRVDTESVTSSVSFSTSSTVRSASLSLKRRAPFS